MMAYGQETRRILENHPREFSPRLPFRSQLVSLVVATCSPELAYPNGCGQQHSVPHDHSACRRARVSEGKELQGGLHRGTKQRSRSPRPSVANLRTIPSLDCGEIEGETAIIGGPVLPSCKGVGSMEPKRRLKLEGSLDMNTIGGLNHHFGQGKGFMDYVRSFLQPSTAFATTKGGVLQARGLPGDSTRLDSRRRDTT